MKVDPRGFDVLMAHDLHDHPRIDAIFQKVRRKRVTKGMTARVLCDARVSNSLPHGLLEHRLMEVVTPFLVGLGMG